MRGSNGSRNISEPALSTPHGGQSSRPDPHTASPFSRRDKRAVPCCSADLLLVKRKAHDAGDSYPLLSCQTSQHENFRYRAVRRASSDHQSCCKGLKISTLVRQGQRYDAGGSQDGNLGGLKDLKRLQRWTESGARFRFPSWQLHPWGSWLGPLWRTPIEVRKLGKHKVLPCQLRAMRSLTNSRSKIVESI